MKKIVSSGATVIRERKRSIISFGKREQGKKSVRTRNMPRNKAEGRKLVFRF